MSPIITSITNRLQPVVDFVKPAFNKLSDVASRIFAAGRDAVAPLAGRVKEPLKNALSSKYTLVTVALGVAGTLVYFGVKQCRKEPSKDTTTPADASIPAQEEPVAPAEAQEAPAEAAAPKTPPQPKKAEKTRQPTPRPKPPVAGLKNVPTTQLIDQFNRSRISQDNRNLYRPEDIKVELDRRAANGDKKAAAVVATVK